MGMDAQTNLFPSALLNFTGNVFPTDIDVIDLHTALWPLKFESAKKDRRQDGKEMFFLTLTWQPFPVSSYRSADLMPRLQQPTDLWRHVNPNREKQPDFSRNKSSYVTSAE